MNRRLVFFWYIDEAYRDCMAYRFHLMELCRHSHVFDEALFVMSMKVDDPIHRSMARSFAEALVAGGFSKSTRFVFETNTIYREAKAFDDHVVSTVRSGDPATVFFGHSKGMSNVWNDSLFVWLCSMYYFGLERIWEIDDVLVNNRRVAYGFPAILSTKKHDDMGFIKPKYGYYYAGTLFWVKPFVLKTLIDEGLAGPIPGVTDRFYAEEFLANTVDSCYCGTYGMVPYYDDEFTLYSDFNVRIFEKLAWRFPDTGISGDLLEYVNGAMERLSGFEIKWRDVE